VWRGHSLRLRSGQALSACRCRPARPFSRGRPYFSQVALECTLCLLGRAVECAPLGPSLRHAFRHVGRFPGTRPKAAPGCPAGDFSASTYSILDSAPIRSLKWRSSCLHNCGESFRDSPRLRGHRACPRLELFCLATNRPRFVAVVAGVIFPTATPVSERAAERGSFRLRHVVLPEDG
jgi:hypothetical protein